MRQYVILGAGMDTFAFRCPELVAQLQVYEVDHPATQADKQNRLVSVGWEQPAQLLFIPADFSRENLAKALASSPYDPDAPSFFSWLGVTYYLERDAVSDTLRAIAEVAHPGSRIVFDYLDDDAFVPGRTARRVQRGMDYLRESGKPMITGFGPSTLTSDLAPLGLFLRDNLSPADIEKRFFPGRTDGYHAYEHMHFAEAVVG